MTGRSEAIHLAVPGRLDQATGGYIYDRRIVEGLRALGMTVIVHELRGNFPSPDAAARAAAAEAWEASRDATLVIDGLALLAFDEALTEQGPRRVVGLVHHPLALETGLDRATRRHFAAAEPKLWRRLDRIIVTSDATARDLASGGVAAERISVVIPGDDRASVPRSRSGATVRLLCVASLSPRKGHGVLLRALAGIRRSRWTLDCVGSLTRDRDCARSVLAQTRLLGLARRVRFRGEFATARLRRSYAAADAFVLASFHEGYGMAFAEALRRGLPVVGTRAGAIPDVVPSRAGLLARPGDPRDLRRALRRLLRGSTRRRLAAGARACGRRFPDWETQARRFAAVLTRSEP